MRCLLVCMVLFGFAASGWAVSETVDGAYVFAYFKEPGSQGIYLASSRDGYA
jgi:hypothetical protein